jgi:hypothetical protein
MKRKLLFALIGAVVIFVWQFLSFAMPNFHKPAMTYTPAQNEILQKFAELGLKEGMYVLGQPDPSLSQDEQRAAMKSLEGKPWAVVNYQEKMMMSMAMPMIRGFLVAFVISFLLFWMFLQQKTPSLTNRLYLALAVGMMSFLFVPYTSFIWYKEPDIWAYFIDGIVPWLILGFIGHRMARVKAEPEQV